jgi:FAD-dependent oxidoreductase domain-containing protein 1
VNGRHDVVVIGGGAVGCAAAYFLLAAAPGMQVAIVEPDPAYEFASTPRASGGARRLFSCPENVLMSIFSIDFLRTLPEIGWRQGGYLFIVPDAGLQVLEANWRTQSALGARVELLDRAGLERRFPSMNASDLGGGAHSPDDGWCDPYLLLQALRRGARALGASVVRDRVVGFERAGSRLRAARLESGASLAAEHFVNAAGAWAGVVGEAAGMPLPVAPLRRFEHYFETPHAVEPLPYVKDLDRLAFRPEGRGYSGGVVRSDAPRGFNFDVDHGYFETVVWPALAHRFPAFEAVRCKHTWSGLYDQCELDGNPVIGNWPGKVDNLYVAAGFSGHGMMHAPAAGRAISELILDGRFRTIDLARLGYARVVAKEPYPERGIV